MIKESELQKECECERDVTIDIVLYCAECGNTLKWKKEFDKNMEYLIKVYPCDHKPY